jgi:hypothetical protein
MAGPVGGVDPRAASEQAVAAQQQKQAEQAARNRAESPAQVLVQTGAHAAPQARSQNVRPNPVNQAAENQQARQPARQNPQQAYNTTLDVRA